MKGIDDISDFLSSDEKIIKSKKNQGPSVPEGNRKVRDKLDKIMKERLIDAAQKSAEKKPQNSIVSKERNRDDLNNNIKSSSTSKPKVLSIHEANIKNRGEKILSKEKKSKKFIRYSQISIKQTGREIIITTSDDNNIQFSNNDDQDETPRQISPKKYVVDDKDDKMDEINNESPPPPLKPNRNLPKDHNKQKKVNHIRINFKKEATLPHVNHNKTESSEGLGKQKAGIEDPNHLNESRSKKSIGKNNIYTQPYLVENPSNDCNVDSDNLTSSPQDHKKVLSKKSTKNPLRSSFKSNEKVQNLNGTLTKDNNRQIQKSNRVSASASMKRPPNEDHTKLGNERDESFQTNNKKMRRRSSNKHLISSIILNDTTNINKRINNNTNISIGNSNEEEIIRYRINELINKKYYSCDDELIDNANTIANKKEDQITKRIVKNEVPKTKTPSKNSKKDATQTNKFDRNRKINKDIDNISKEPNIASSNQNSLHPQNRKNKKIDVVTDNSNPRKTSRTSEVKSQSLSADRSVAPAKTPPSHKSEVSRSSISGSIKSTPSKVQIAAKKYIDMIDNVNEKNKNEGKKVDQHALLMATHEIINETLKNGSAGKTNSSKSRSKNGSSAGKMIETIVEESPLEYGEDEEINLEEEDEKPGMNDANNNHNNNSKFAVQNRTRTSGEKDSESNNKKLSNRLYERIKPQIQPSFRQLKMELSMNQTHNSSKSSISKKK